MCIESELQKKRKEAKKKRNKEYYLRDRNDSETYEASLMKLTYPSYFVYNLKYELQAEFYCKKDLMEFINVDLWKTIYNHINRKSVVGDGLGYLVKTHKIILT